MKDSINKSTPVQSTETLAPKKVQLVRGEYSLDEAAEIIYSLLDQKINFHKKAQLKLWEGFHHADMGQLTHRISELEQEKKSVSDLLSSMMGTKANLKINGILELTPVNHESEQGS